METGNLAPWSWDECGGEFNSGGGDATVSQEIAHSGQYSARLEINTDDGRSHATRLIRWCEPWLYRAAYYSAWYYFPQRVDVQAGWWNIFQFKSRTDSTNDPWWILNVGNRHDGSMYVYLRDWIHKRSYEQNVANLPIGRWVHIEVYVRSSGGRSGQITVWQDEAKIIEVKNVQTYYPGGAISWSVNSYSESLSPRPTVIYIDDVAISLERLGRTWTAVREPEHTQN